MEDYNFRTLNYLGSKLRLLDFIEHNVQQVTPEGAGVCDLFAGSGCVSYKLSKSHPTIACDVQAYSKVISNALFGCCSVSGDEINSFLHGLNTDFSLSLTEAFAPLTDIEERAINNKDMEVLACLLEHGSLEVFSLEKTHSLLEKEQQAVCEILSRKGLLGRKSLISRYYGGVYFSYRQAVAIDVILEAIDLTVPVEHRDVYLAALLSTASDIVDTVGKHFAQPVKARDSKGKIKSTVYNKAVKDKAIDVFSLYEKWLLRYTSLPHSKHECATLQGDFKDCLQALPASVRTIYADPPYTREHYSRFYHVLETITKRDVPSLSTTCIHGARHISNGIYREDRHQSPFCIRSKAPEAFNRMFSFAAESNRNLLLSYSPYDETKATHPRVVTMQQLTSWAKDHFAHVETVSAGAFKHNKLNSTEHLLEASDEAELLIICKNE